MIRSPIKRKLRRKGRLPPEVAQAVLARDGDCRAYAHAFGLDVHCRGHLELHHRLSRAQGGPDTEDNLVCLCSRHHALAHDERRADAEASGVIIRSGG